MNAIDTLRASENNETINTSDVVDASRFGRNTYLGVEGLTLQKEEETVKSLNGFLDGTEGNEIKNITDQETAERTRMATMAQKSLDVSAQGYESVIDEPVSRNVIDTAFNTEQDTKQVAQMAVQDGAGADPSDLPFETSGPEYVSV